MSLTTLQRDLADARARFVSPFFVLGDPDPETSLALIEAALDGGATWIELGIPFSDPVADGPAIQAAGRRAARGGTTVPRALELLQRIRQRTEVPLNLLVYANLAHARGYGRFAQDLAAAGASSVLVPDLPLEEDAPLAAGCARSGLGLVRLVGPSTPPERAAALAAGATFLYVTGHQGVTGQAAPPDAGAQRDATTDEGLRARIERVPGPAAVGFGLRNPADVARVFRAGGRAAVVGSAFARCIERYAERGLERPDVRAALLADVRQRTAELCTALSESSPASLSAR